MDTIELLKKQDEYLMRFYDKFSNSNFEALLSAYPVDYVKSKVSLSNLRIMSELIEGYLENIDNSYSRGDELNKVFGLLQALFVSIDSLYELSRGITRNKWSLNINGNRHLLEIKFIRNDVVGHPSNRHFSKSEVGFCTLNLNKTNIKEISYNIFTINNKSVDKEEKNVVLDEIIHQYLIESNKSLKMILSKLDYEIKSVNRDLTVCLTDHVYKLYNIYINNNKSQFNDELKLLEDSYREIQNLSNDDVDKFLWKISLIKELTLWKEDNISRKEVIDYITKKQLSILHSMSLTIDKKNDIKYTKSKISNIKIPSLLKFFYKKILSDENTYKNYVRVLHEPTDPYFNSSLRLLKNRCDGNTSVLDIIDWMQSLTNDLKSNKNKIYLLGSNLKKYKTQISNK